MGKSIEIEKAELLLGLEVSKAALEMDAGFVLQVGKHKFVYNWGHITQSDTWLGTVEIDDLSLGGLKDEVSAILTWLITLCQNAMNVKCSFSTKCFTFTFESYVECTYPVLPKGVSALEWTRGDPDAMRILATPTSAIPTVNLTVEERDDENTDSQKEG